MVTILFSWALLPLKIISLTSSQTNQVDGTKQTIS